MMVLNDRLFYTGRWDFRPFVTPWLNGNKSVEHQIKICLSVSKKSVNREKIQKNNKKNKNYFKCNKKSVNREKNAKKN